MKYPKIVAAFVTGGSITLHRQVSDETLETVSIAPGDKGWLKAAEAVAHFAQGHKPLADFTG